MQEIPEKIDSKFRFVLLAANRAEQLLRGALPKREHGPVKVTRAAMNEVFEESIDWDYGPAVEPVLDDPVDAEPAVAMPSDEATA